MSKLKTNEINLVFLGMFFEATFFQNHAVFGVSDEAEHGRHGHHHPISERSYALVMRLLFEAIFAMLCKISSMLLCTYSVLQVNNIRYCSLQSTIN